MRLFVKAFVMDISCGLNFYSLVAWNRALHELGEANPYVNIVLRVNEQHLLVAYGKPLLSIDRKMFVYRCLQM